MEQQDLAAARARENALVAAFHRYERPVPRKRPEITAARPPPTFVEA